MEDMLKLGPENMEGSTWDEGGKTDIVQILISYDQYCIRSIQFVYVVDGNVLPSKIRGKLNPMRLDAVAFDYPREYLVSVSGYQQDRLTSITFVTNKRKYGPFGNPDNPYDRRKFAYNFSPKSSFGGFHGSVKFWPSNADYVPIHIGIYVRPVRSLLEIDTKNTVRG